VSLDNSQLPLQDVVVDLPANITGVTVDGKAVGASIDALEADVAAHDVLLTHQGQAGERGAHGQRLGNARSLYRQPKPFGGNCH
jgi:hypothetical protein